MFEVIPWAHFQRRLHTEGNISGCTVSQRNTMNLATVTEIDVAAIGTESIAGQQVQLRAGEDCALLDAAPYDALDTVIRRAADLFGNHVVWASDWPHTSFAPDAMPAYESVLAPVVRALGEWRAVQAREAGARLYS